MGFFDAITDLVSAVTPWTEHEAEAVSGGSSEEKTPANATEGEGEAKVSLIQIHYYQLEGREGIEEAMNA